MMNFIKNRLKFNKNLVGEEKRNENELQALLDAEGENIKRSRYNFQPARQGFQEKLKQRILERRKNSMKKLIQAFKDCFTVERLKPAMIFVVIIAVVAGTVNFLPFLLLDKNGTKDLSKQFSKLIINSAYAMDNFDLKPESIDSAGVTGNTAYILTSKEQLDSESIKDNITVEPNVEIDIKAISPTEWKIVPKEVLSPNTIFKVTLNSTYYDENKVLQKRDYNWAYQVKDSFKVLTTIPGNASTNVPTNTGIEIMFSHDNFIDFEKYFSISPSAEGRFEKHGRTLVFVPTAGLKEGTIYTVTVKAGLPMSNSEEKIKEDKVIQFETNKIQEFYGGQGYFNIYDKMLEFSSSEMPVIEIYTDRENQKANVKAYKFNSDKEYLDALEKNNKIPWWSNARDAYVYDTSKLTAFRSFSVETKKGQYIKFIEFPEKLPVGFYAIDFELNGRKQQAWFQVTDLSAYINTTKTETIVWVNDLVKKKPVDGAQIKVLGGNAQYKTNSDGVAVFNTSKETIDCLSTNYLEITDNGRNLILPINNSDCNGNSASDKVGEYWRYLYVDKPQYQPTDKIKFWGMVKNRDGQKINDKVTLVLVKNGYVDYYYNPVNISEQEIVLDDFGVYSGEISITNIVPDYYSLQLKVGDTVISDKYIEVRPYVKPAYQLSLIPDRKAALAGDNINFDVQASFFEGTPVPNLPLVFTMPEGDYKFTTDENGKAKLTYTKKYINCEYNSCWPESAWLKISPQNSELAEITAEASVRFFAGDRYATTKVNYPGKGQAELKISSFVLDLKQAEKGDWRDNMGDKAAPNTKIEGKVTKITYTKTQTGTYYDFISKKSYPTYNYNTNEEKVDSFTVNSDSEGIYNYKRRIDPNTSYRIDLKVFDKNGHYDTIMDYLYYNDNNGLNHYDSYNNNYYHFALEDKTYNIDEKVNIDMQNSEKSLPDGGDNRYLFLQMQNGLQEYSISDNSTYDFTFEKRDVPNVNVDGVYFNGSAYFVTNTRWSFGDSDQIKYNTDNSKLDIEIKTDKSNYKPGEDITISLSTKNKEGQPVKAEVNVNVIDEAYYAIIEDAANPIDEIYSAVTSGSYFSKYSHKTINDSVNAEGGGCFLAGTKILMSDGTTKVIEDIKPEDEIKTIVDTLRIKYGTGKVSEVFKHTVGGYLIINNKLRLTPEHRVYSNYSFVMAGQLRLGDWLLGEDGNKIFITSIDKKKEIVEVYNFRVEPQHTYIADGFYVHNDKGGVREILVDAPLFASVTTDNNGRASVSFKLPDNVTSWRITAQAISKDMEVGTAKGNINVSLPVFIDATIGSEYLVEDKPIARLRAYGTALKNSDDVAFNLEAGSLGVKKTENIIAKAFKSAFVELPKFILGKHDIIYRVETGKGQDALKLPIDVISSRLLKLESNEGVLATDTKINADTENLIAVTLGDKNRTQIYSLLQSLGWSWDDRIDSAVARKKSYELRNNLFNDGSLVPEISAAMYQKISGGISLLPYSSEDLTLSTELASVAPEEFDSISLEQYFLRIFNDKDSNREEITAALYGLASLKVPVLSLLNNWISRDDLSVKEKLYTALAFHEMGATEKARSIYYEIADKYAQQKLPSIKISIDDNKDTTEELTALTAVLAASVQAPEKQGYWFYLNNDSHISDIVIDLEKIAYIQEAAPDISNSAAKVVYEIDGNKKTVDFSNLYTYSFTVTPAQANSVKFDEVAGDIGITTVTSKPFASSTEKSDSDIGIRREFYVNGQKTNSFKEDDNIEVRIYPTIGDNALTGDYQITDILPSGLVPVTKYYYGGDYSGDCSKWYPYNNDGQKVKYMIRKGWNKNNCNRNYISYLARVKTKGEYKVETPTIQSLVNPDYLNFDKTSSTVIIK